MDEGSRQLGIDRYNGGLFARDTLLDERLTVPDKVCRGFDRLAAYYYGLPTAAEEEPSGKAARLIDVEILGHIFEQSISDLEQLRNALAGDPAAKEAKAGPSRRQGGVLHPVLHHPLHRGRDARASAAQDDFESLRRIHHGEAPAAVRQGAGRPQRLRSRGPTARTEDRPC